MSDSDRSEHSDADTHKSVDTGDSGQPKNNMFLGSKSEFHPALAISDIRNDIPVILEILALHADPFWTTGNPVPYNSAVNKKYGTLKFQTSTEMDQEHNTLVASEFLSAPCRRKRYVE
ncbi:hypothetical protein KIW84_064637 [Lathyrus oleraceus]|uniref:Uncharacterized protein n=1 Tax=Pisum sativum TaxID=3888 RepID=A0A9D5A6F6_PEA|nr:hypothetical protein KIW84_064637 [Pisum sativum]